MSGEEEERNLINYYQRLSTSATQNLQKRISQTNITEEVHTTETHRTPLEDSLGSEVISLEAALKLLSNKFRGKSQEEMKIFLKKCDFSLSCSNRRLQARLLREIIVRLIRKA